MKRNKTNYGNVLKNIVYNNISPPHFSEREIAKASALLQMFL